MPLLEGAGPLDWRTELVEGRDHRFNWQKQPASIGFA